MFCERIEKLLIEYLDQELNQEETSFVRAHIHQCLSCSKKLKELEQLRVTARKSALLPEGVFFEEMRRDLFERIRESRPSKEVAQPAPRRSWVPVLVPVTLALVLMVGLWVLPGRYQEYAMKKDLVELAKLDGEMFDLYPPGEVASLEAEDAMTEEFMRLAQADTTGTEQELEEELELLNALGEGEGISEGEFEDLEEELSSLDADALG